MAKRPNPTIGMILCPLCDELGAVRRDRSARLYYVCHCGGPHPLTGERGAAFVDQHGTIWNDGEPPADAPEWIRRGLGFPPGTRSPFSRPRTSAPAPEPEPEPELELDDDDERFTGGLFL